MKTQKEVELHRIHPNPWNPNRMSGGLFDKLVTNIEEQYARKGKKQPPIIVRPHPSKKKSYEIIDGFHRWKASKQLKLDKMNVFVLDVNDEQARVLTGNLNYLRGEKDPEKYTAMLNDLLKNEDNSVEKLARILPESAEELQDMIITWGDGEATRRLLDKQDEQKKKEDKTEGLKEEDVFLDLVFRVSLPQSRIIKKEVNRIAKAIKGNNAEARALEYIAVNSSQTELPPDLQVDIDSKELDEEDFEPLEQTAAEKLRKRMAKLKHRDSSNIEEKMKEKLK